MNFRTRGLSLLTALTIGAASLLFAACDAQAANTATTASLTVTVTGIASGKGAIMGAVCEKQEFLKQCAHASMEKANANGTVALHFNQLPPGDYAVMVFHDENDNRKFDRAPNGIPLEGYAFSHNAKGNYGPPTFEQAMISLKPGDNQISVELVY